MSGQPIGQVMQLGDGRLVMIHGTEVRELHTVQPLQPQLPPAPVLIPQVVQQPLPPQPTTPERVPQPIQQRREAQPVIALHASFDAMKYANLDDRTKKLCLLLAHHVQSFLQYEVQMEPVNVSPVYTTFSFNVRIALEKAKTETSATNERKHLSMFDLEEFLRVVLSFDMMKNDWYNRQIPVEDVVFDFKNGTITFEVYKDLDRDPSCYTSSDHEFDDRRHAVENFFMVSTGAPNIDDIKRALGNNPDDMCKAGQIVTLMLRGNELNGATGDSSSDLFALTLGDRQYAVGFKNLTQVPLSLLMELKADYNKEVVAFTVVYDSCSLQMLTEFHEDDPAFSIKNCVYLRMNRSCPLSRFVDEDNARLGSRMGRVMNGLASYNSGMARQPNTTTNVTDFLLGGRS